MIFFLYVYHSHKTDMVRPRALQFDNQIFRIISGVQLKANFTKVPFI